MIRVNSYRKTLSIKENFARCTFVNAFIKFVFLFFFIAAVNIDLLIDCETQRPRAGSSNTVRSEGSLASTQEVLNYIARKCFQENDASDPDNGFLRYMKNERKVSVVNIKEGSIIFTLECRSLQSLDELWEDFSTGQLTEVAQVHLVTEDILKQFSLSSLNLTANIKEEDYRDCRQRLAAIEGE